MSTIILHPFIRTEKADLLLLTPSVWYFRFIPTSTHTHFRFKRVSLGGMEINQLYRYATLEGNMYGFS